MMDSFNAPRAMRRLFTGATALLLACSDDNGAPPGPEATPSAIVAAQLQGVPQLADNPSIPAKVELGGLL
jgi:hypothetical protein